MHENIVVPDGEPEEEYDGKCAFHDQRRGCVGGGRVVAIEAEDSDGTVTKARISKR
jgi:hypothetical protein